MILSKLIYIIILALLLLIFQRDYQWFRENWHNR